MTTPWVLVKRPPGCMARLMAVECLWSVSIPGYGTGGGFEFQLLDQSSGVYSLNEFFGSAQQIIQTANTDPVLNQVYSLFSPQAPQYKIDVDREQMASLGVDFGSAMSTFSINFGGRYVNDTFQEGKVRRVYVQADEVSRATPQRLSAICRQCEG